MVDVNERAEARHVYRCGERNRDRRVGRGLRRRELAVAVGDRLLAVAWALAQGTGWLARRRQLVRIAEVSGRRDLGAKALDAFGREPLLEESGGQRVRGPGTVGSPPARSVARRRTPKRGFYRSFPLAAQATQYKISSSPLAGLLGVAPIGGRPMKPVRRTKSRTPPTAAAAMAAATATTANAMTSRRLPDFRVAPARPRTSSQLPGKRLGRQQGESSAQQAVVVRAHAVTSFVVSSAASCSWAWDRVAATVPSAMPSTSPIWA